MMKTKYLLTVVGLLLCCLTVSAQDTDAMKKEISSVKKSSQYLYGEAVAATAAEAKDMAEDLLYTEINKWADSQKKMSGKAIVVSNKKEFQNEVALPRGNMFRCFIYVKKSDIISADNATVVREASEVPAPQSTVSASYPETVLTIASYTDYHQMANKIKELKAAEKIGHYAFYGNLERPEIYYLVIYNQQGEVLSVLTPGQQRTNVKTGQPDKIGNYSGCGAIGFTVNK